MSRYTAANKLIGRRIRAARKIMLITQRALGAAAGVGAKRIGEYERGEVTIPAPLLALIACRLDHNIDELMPRIRIYALLRGEKRT